jgi:hypothetical protein
MIDLTGILGAAIKCHSSTRGPCTLSGVSWIYGACTLIVANAKLAAPYVRETQAGMLTSPGDSAGIGLVFAAALMESETTQLAPANAMQMALPAQLK